MTYKASKYYIVVIVILAAMFSLDVKSITHLLVQLSFNSKQQAQEAAEQAQAPAKPI